MITAEHIRSVFARYCELVSRGDADAIAMLYAPDATVEDPVGSPPHRASAGAVRLELEGRVRVAGQAGAAAMVARTVADSSLRIETLDVMTFDDAGLITGMCAYWSADTIVRE